MNARSGDFHHLPQQGHSVQSPYKVLCKIQQHNSRRHHRSFGMSRPLRSTRRAAALANERLSAISSKWLDMCCVMMIPHWIMRPSGRILDDDAEGLRRACLYGTIRWVVAALVILWIPYSLVSLTVCFITIACRRRLSDRASRRVPAAGFGFGSCCHCEYIIIQNGMLFWTVSLLQFF